MIPHSDFGDPVCCGCLDAIFRGYDADITCNECGQAVRTVLGTDLQRTLDEMFGHISLQTFSVSRIQPGYEAQLRFDGKTYPLNPSVRPAVPLAKSVQREVILSTSEKPTLLYPTP
jgi:hypothetical protein